MTTFIVGAMPLDDEYVRTLIESVPEKDRFIIACDKGYYYINMAGYSPDLVVGDFDSADSDLYEQLMRDGKEVIKLNPIKDDTDIEAALQYAFECTKGDIIIIGAIGGRLDHTLGNVALLGMGLNHNRKIYLVDGLNRLQMIKAPEKITIKKASQHGKYISVFPYMGPVSGLTMEGFKYPLSDATLEGFNTLTVSNEIVDETATISIGEGYLIICETTD